MHNDNGIKKFTSQNLFNLVVNAYFTLTSEVAII